MPAALAFRRVCTKISSVLPSASMAPQAMFHTSDRDHNFVQIPFLIWDWTVTPDAIYKMTPKSINPRLKRFLINDDTTLSQEIFNIRRTQGEPVIRPNRVGNHLAWITRTFQAWQISWNVNRCRLPLIPISYNLAIPDLSLTPPDGRD